MARDDGAPKPVRIGTRKSNLAMIQAESIRAKLQQIAPGRTFEVHGLSTKGDKDQATALSKLGDKSLWTFELEELLTSGQLDVIVHCLKDMPTTLPDSCVLAAIPSRDDPRDAVVMKRGLPYTSLATLPDNAVVGTSSVRRSAQLSRLYPHLKFANLRGNVETRLRKVDDPESEYSCMIMSAAGLLRVGLGPRITQYLGRKDRGIMHAVGQGALGLEVRKGDTEMLALLNQLADRRSTLACLAERALMRALEGGCSVPIGVETEWLDGSDDEVLEMSAIVLSLDGQESIERSSRAFVRSEEEALALGEQIAASLVQGGAGHILQAVHRSR